MIGAFQMRGLRYILGVEHTYYLGVSNEEIYERINVALNEGEDLNIEWSEVINAHKYSDRTMLQKVSDYIMRQQNSLYGHIIRADPSVIMRPVTINRELGDPQKASFTLLTLQRVLGM